MAILTAVIESKDTEIYQMHREVHTIGHFLENDAGQIVYSDGEVIDKDDLQGFIKSKIYEYYDLLREEDDNILGTENYGSFYDFYIYDAKIEYGINDVTEKLGYLRKFN